MDHNKEGFTAKEKFYVKHRRYYNPVFCVVGRSAIPSPNKGSSWSQTRKNIVEDYGERGANV